MIDVVNATEIVASHAEGCDCDTCTYAREQMKYCPECNKLHEKIAFCTGCGACLYTTSIQIKDEQFPFFKCTKCGKVSFWD
jgi:ribosomal protein L33